MNTAMQNLPAVRDNQALAQVIQQVKEQSNSLIPEMLNFVKPDIKLGFQLISVDTNLPDETYNIKDTTGAWVKKSKKALSNNDIYSVDGGKFALHLKKLNEIAQGAGLRIIDSKILMREVDAEGRATFIKHQVRWEMKQIDGSTKVGVATGEYNYQEDMQRFFKASQTADDNKQIQKRRNYAGALAESNAVSRAIQQALPKLKASYKIEELKKPFLVPCVIQDVTEMLNEHPDLKRAYIAQQLGLTNFLFPQPTQPSIELEEKQQLTLKPQEPKKEVAEEIKDAVMVEQPQAEESKEEAQELPDFELEATISEWEQASQEDRATFILKKAKETGVSSYKDKPITAEVLAKASVKGQCDLIRLLITTQTKEVK